MAAVAADPVQALNEALAKAQGAFPTITKDKTADTGTYKYRYADLGVILAAVRPVLAENGLAVTQQLEDIGHGLSIRTELRHASGGVIGSSFPLPSVPDSPQKLGSMITYMRRYAITAVLGIATEDDDDGQAASDGAQPARAPKKVRKAPGTDTDKPARAPKMQEDQRRKLFALFGKSEFTERSARIAWTQTMIGRKIQSSDELTRAEADRLIEILTGRIEGKRDPGPEAEPEPPQDRVYDDAGEIPFGELPADY